jgi:hypothetical protein
VPGIKKVDLGIRQITLECLPTGCDEGWSFSPKRRASAACVDAATPATLNAGNLAYGPRAARLITIFGYELDAKEAVRGAL